MFKKLSDYEKYIWTINPRKISVDKHHILPIQAYWPDTKENIQVVLQNHHKLIHENLDIAFRYFAQVIRKQRQRENWHIVLTESDIEGRADIQRSYLEWVDKLPMWWMIDMHEIKLWQLAELENEKLFRLTWDKMDIELWDTLTNHGHYVDIQKELSKEIYKRLKNK